MAPKRGKISPESFPLKQLAFAVALAFAAAHSAYALPTGEQVVAGDVSVSRPDARNLAVNQGSVNAIVNWQGFSIRSNEGVTFNQPSAASVILNRVVGNDASGIYGSLTANGKVFLVNPNGVLFAPGASVNVGGLVASTLDIGNDDFRAGRYRFSGNGGTVENRGDLHASDYGTIVLLGGKVRNDGTITAKLGTVGLAAGNKVTVDFAGDGLTRLTVDEAAIGAQIANGGMAVADGGQAILTASAADKLAGTVINQTGIVRAQSLVERNGKIVLDSGARGDVLVSGALDASGKTAGTKGGEVQVLGQHVGLVDTARVDASGDAGGGAALIGGDYQGKNALVRNAEATFMGANAMINADAVTAGNGGKVIVWGNEATRAYGAISAKGGEQSGNGGLVETSGKYLDANGVRVSAAAPSGTAGEWLLDPNDIFIGAVCDGPCLDTRISGNPDFTSTDNSALLSTATIEAVLNSGTSVSVTTGTAVATPPVGAGPIIQPGNITVESSIEKSAGGEVSLTLSAHNHIVIFEGVTISSSAPGGPLNINLNSNLDGLGGGAVFIGAPRDGVGALIATNGGSLRIFGGCNPPGCDPTAANLTGHATGNQTTIDVAVSPALVALTFLDGVNLQNAFIDTRVGGTPGGPSGNILIRGQGADGTSGAGIRIANTSLLTSNGTVTLEGVAGPGGTGVDIGSGFAGVCPGFASCPTIGTGSGLISIFGRAPGSSSSDPIGVDFSSALIETIAGGNVEIRGRGEAPGESSPRGVFADAGIVRTSGSGAGNIEISGESTGSGAGLRIAGSESASQIGSPTTTGSIVLRATNDDSGFAIALNGQIATTGIVNLRPGGVAADGGLTGSDSEPIRLVAEAEGEPFGFVLSPRELDTIQDGTAGIVIGSSTHTGAISYALPYTWRDNLTLQNGGAGSAGINIASALNNPGNLITLSSGGTVTQTAPITAANLLLHGTQSQSNFQLTNASNNVGQFVSRFEVAKDLEDLNFGDVNYVNRAALTIGPLTGVGFDSAGNQATVIDASDSTSGGDFFVRTLSGNLNVGITGNAHDITTLGSDITLVTAGVFNNAGNGTLNPGGDGRFLVFADTFVGENRGGDLVGTSPQPNFYNRTFDACGVPGACGIPTTGNRFVYRTQPTLTLGTGDQSRIYGEPNPAFPPIPSGLVNGDTLSDAVSGGFSTAATPASNVGGYAVTGSFVSPVGYALNVVPGTLTVNQARLTLVADPQSRLEGTPNPPLTGTVTGFVVGDTVATATTGSLVFNTPADTFSPAGLYPINGSGLDARNYFFVQAPSNADALAVSPSEPPMILPPPIIETPPDPSIETPVDPVISTRPDRLLLGIDQAPRQSREPGFDDSYVYESNLGLPELCAAPGPLTVVGGGSTVGDLLDREWARVRLNPNLSNCINVDEQNGCDDF